MEKGKCQISLTETLKEEISPPPTPPHAVTSHSYIHVHVFVFENNHNLINELCKIVLISAVEYFVTRIAIFLKWIQMKKLTF